LWQLKARAGITCFNINNYNIAVEEKRKQGVCEQERHELLGLTRQTGLIN